MDIVLYGLLPVSPVLFARHATGSFAWASIVLGADTAGTVIAAPARCRLLDLKVRGQRCSGWCARRAATAPVGAAMRNAWSDLNTESSDRSIAYATLAYRR